MFHTVADFIQLWQDEAKHTQTLLEALTDESLNKQLAPNVRTIKQLVWHIIETPHELLGNTGLKIAGAEDKSRCTSGVRSLIEAHNHVAGSVSHQVQTHWNNKTLHQTDPMYGEVWTRSQSLLVLVTHMIHHRGQLTVLMRLAGLKVPGIYGPAKEEWAKMGMQPPDE